ncbi:MAG: hypothetical protein JXL84_11415 [Deltaproteobacteria bacterium]|nr:hypothetical protein [Deltaproteobacteria bacterium]
MSLEIEKGVLEMACREMIETILFCLPNAFKGTIYRVGKPPELITERITSGVIDAARKGIAWGLPEKSEYNPPGRPWLDYRDEPGRPMEAMAWCVEKQKSWTSEDPRNDSRSVKLQVEGMWEDSHHMEPVLVRKLDLHLDMYSTFDYPKDYCVNTIWQDSDYVVVAVIKIHFQPYTIRMGSPETVVIKKLSRLLGTELLSHHLHQDSLRAMQQLARDRINACNILADSLRNAVAKGALVFSLVKQEIGYLRDQWERLLLEILHEKSPKFTNIESLNKMVLEINGDCGLLRQDLIGVQKRFLELSLPPQRAENWVVMQIEERWKDLFEKCAVNEEKRKAIWEVIAALKKSLYFGIDVEVLKCCTHLIEDTVKEWTSLIYDNSDRFERSKLDRLIHLLSTQDFGIPSQDKSRKTLIQLKALAQTLGQLEQNTNFLLRQVLNGGEGTVYSRSPNNSGEGNGKLAVDMTPRG